MVMINYRYFDKKDNLNSNNYFVMVNIIMETLENNLKSQHNYSESVDKSHVASRQVLKFLYIQIECRLLKK